MAKRTLAFSFILTLVTAIGSLPASAGSWMPTGAAAIPPGGFLGFCVKHLQDCRSSAPDPVPRSTTTGPPSLYSMSGEAAGLKRFDSTNNKLDPSAVLTIDATLTTPRYVVLFCA